MDLNADLGEGFGRWSLTDDDALLDVVTSANTACGFHAGDPSTMRRVCERAKGAKVEQKRLADELTKLPPVADEELTAARGITEIVSVQNLYNLTNRQSQDVLDHATAEGIAFIPWFPIATGDLAKPDSPVADIARELDASPSQVALAWLLQTSPVVLPIPGTKSVDHLTENLGAASLTLSAEDVARLDALA